MIKKLLVTLSVIILFGSAAYSQSTIQGSVKSAGGTPQQAVMVQLLLEDRVVNGAYTDDKGEYQIFGVSAGTYNVVAGGGICPQKQTHTDVIVKPSETKFLDFTIDCSSTELKEVVVVYKAPLFDPDNTKSSDNISGDEVRKLPGRSLSGALANLGGVAGVDGSISSVRGNRPDGQQTIVDGVRLRGGGISMQAVESAELIQGGIPAEYGDGTSYMVYTTKGISPNYHGNFEAMGSIDGYNNFLLAGMITGPMQSEKAKKANKPASAGFLLSAEGYYNQESAPARGGVWVANDELIESLTKNPLQYDMVSLGTTYPYASFLTNDGENFSKVHSRPNVANYGCQVDAKFDFLTGAKDGNGRRKNNLRFTVGASYQFSKGRNSSGQSGYLFNAKNNSLSVSNALRLSARINHRIQVDTATAKWLKNVMYDINFTYTIAKSETMDARHKRNYFNYGHIGKFTTTKANYYTPVESLVIMQDSIPITYYDVTVLATVYDSIVSFDGSNSSNPDLAWYTQNFVDNYPNTFFNDLYGSEVSYSNETYRSFGALLNGDGAPTVEGLFYLPGAVMSSYGKSSSNSIGAKASLSMNIKKHELKLGFEFDKVTSRYWGISAYSLWTLMRQYQNSHISQLDVSNPIFNAAGDTISYNQLYVAGDQTAFDRNLRSKLGLDPNGTDWLDIDSYDPNVFDINMFSVSELFNSGSPYVSYYGYDYTGTKINKNNTNISSFFGVADDGSTIEAGSNPFNIGAYEPVYMAMYIQDKFAIRSLLFNVGLRIDRFDANQSVLKDPYLFRSAHTVSSLLNADNGFSDNIVSNAEDSWVVYIDQQGQTPDASTQTILGYRDGTTWYDAEGQEIVDPKTVIGETGGPILLEEVDAESYYKNVSVDAFEDYKPNWSIMPRISFSFPVSDQSLFYAHYNIITYRPSDLQLSPITYLFIDKYAASGTVLTNPKLKPQKSIDYEIGFRQKIGDNSAISIAAYYSEKRDQIQSYYFSCAYPTSYYSYYNMDFGTVQGFTFGYNLRSKTNLTLRASYTLQFAKGTGSSASSNLAIIQSGQPNLRTLTNLSFDQRHRLTADLFYDFEMGSKYKGPKTEYVSKKTGKKKEIRWFAGAGASLRFSAASGQPYSRSSTAFSSITGEGKSQLSGSINGSNMPWIFQCDLRIYKSWAVNFAKESNEGKGKDGSIMVYLDIQNLFNFKNIVSVYTYTGNAEDDGYLSASQFQQSIEQRIYTPAYIDYYTMLMQNPYNYSMPIRASLGVQFNF